MNSLHPALEIIAHRGNSQRAPENTLAALALGWKETTTCEVDIRPTLDRRLLVIHDASTLRTTGTDLNVAQHPLGCLQLLDAGSWKGPAWAHEKLPTLDEAIAAIPPGKRLLVEIKAGPEVVPELTRVIRASGREQQIALHSFDLSTCIEARKAFPDLPVYFLLAFTADPESWQPALGAAIQHALRAGLNGINVNDVPFLDAAVPQIHAADLSVCVWTIDDRIAAKRLVAGGVDGLITNRPGWLKSQIEG